MTKQELTLALKFLDYSSRLYGSFGSKEIYKDMKQVCLVLNIKTTELLKEVDKVDPALAGELAIAYENEELER